MDSDEFNAHIQKHTLDELARFTDTLAKTLGTQGADPLEALAETVANLVVDKIRPVFSAATVRMAVKAKPTFEAIELTRMAIQHDKPAPEVFETYKQVLRLLSEHEEKDGSTG